MKALTATGRAKYREWVEGLAAQPASPVPDNIIYDDELSFSIPETPEIVPKVYLSKYEFAAEMYRYVKAAEDAKVDHNCWPGIWDALALIHFQVICPQRGNGAWQPKDRVHYIYTPNYKVRHRHRVYGPVTLYRTHSEGVRPFFQGKPSVLGEYEEQIGSSQELAGSAVVLQVLKRLYAIDGGGKRGYTSLKRFKGYEEKLPAPGSLRRFVQICKQLRRTYDLASIDVEPFISLLPAEFKSWLSDNS